MSTTIIKVDSLEKRYGENIAVNGISFDVEQGAIFGMLGPNGAGKTTTMETLIGFSKKSGGTIEILGMDPSKDIKKLKKKIGVQLQSSALFMRLSVKELLDLYAGFYDNAFHAEDVIKMVGLEDKVKSRTYTLSGGQQHRLAIALAIITNGDILFLDEPTTGLDPQSRRKLWDTLLNLKKMGKTIFLTTHYMDEAEILCDEIIIIDFGKIIAKGKPSDLIDQYLGGDTIKFLAADFSEEELKGMEHLKGVIQADYSDTNNNVTIYTDNYTTTIIELLNYIKSIEKNIVNLQFRKPTLDDLFIKLTGRGLENESV